MKTDQQIIDMFHKQHGSWGHGGSKQLTNTRDCQAFYAGDFMSYTDRLQYADGRGNKKSVMVQFNKVKPYVNAVRGFMAQNRQKADYSAKHPNVEAQEFYTKYSNDYKDNVREKANADQIETQQDGDMLICGYGAVETAISYGEGHSTRSPNGEIIMGRIDPKNFYWDHTARAPGLLDSRFKGYKKTYILDDALVLFDDSRPEDFESFRSDDSGNKVYYKRGGTYNKIQELYDVEQGKEELIKVYFHQWYEIDIFYRAANPLQDIQDPQLKIAAYMEMKSILDEQRADPDIDDEYLLNPDAAIISVDKSTMKKLKHFFDMGKKIDFKPFKRKVFYTAVLSGQTVFQKYRNACQQGFTIKVKTGDYDESNKMWVGMVNSLRDPALYYNKALTELLMVIASQAKGGVMAERSAISDVASFEAKYAKTDAVAIVEDGALQKGMIKPKKEGYTASGIEEIIQAADSALPEVSGIDKTFLVSSENKIESGILHRQRIKQVTSALATYFDSITLYQREHARNLLPFLRIMAENNEGSLFKAQDSDGSVIYLHLSQSNFVDEYDVNIIEAPDTATQKAETGDALMKLATLLMGSQNPSDQAAGRQALAAAIKLLPLDFTDRQTIVKALMPQQGDIDPAYVQKLEQQVHALMDEGNKSEIAKRLSAAHLDMMKGEHIISEIKKNKAEIKMKGAQTEQIDIENQVIQRQPTKDVEINA